MSSRKCASCRVLSEMLAKEQARVDRLIGGAAATRIEPAAPPLPPPLPEVVEAAIQQRAYDSFATAANRRYAETALKEGTSPAEVAQNILKGE